MNFRNITTEDHENLIEKATKKLATRYNVIIREWYDTIKIQDGENYLLIEGKKKRWVDNEKKKHDEAVIGVLHYLERLAQDELDTFFLLCTYCNSTTNKNFKEQFELYQRAWKFWIASKETKDVPKASSWKKAYNAFMRVGKSYSALFSMMDGLLEFGNVWVHNQQLLQKMKDRQLNGVGVKLRLKLGGFYS
jgi:hypothetical protein